MTIHQDADIYNYYPSGLFEAFSQLGGLLAFFNIGIALNFIQKRWFNNEMNQIISQSKIVPVNDKEEDEEERGKKPKTQTQVDTIYSIEYYNKLIERVQQIKEDMKRCFSQRNLIEWFHNESID